MSEIHAVEPEEIMAYLDGELPAARAAEALTHLERCAECQKLAADLRRVSGEMTAWQVKPPRAMAAPVAGAPLRLGWVLGSPIRVPAYVLALAPLCGIVLLLFILSPQSPRGDTGLGAVSGSGLAQTARNRAMTPPPPPQAAPAPMASAEKAALVTPMIERTATLNLATRDFDQVRARVDAILARRHGYLAELTLNAPQGAGRSLNATLRVPVAELDAALADFRHLGRVENESQKGEDVTRAYTDLVARLTNARNTEQRLTQILAQRTGKLSDVLDVEREISRVRGEIEQMEAERRTTADQVAFATVQLNAGEAYQAQLRLAPDSTLTRLRNAAVEGYKNLAGGVVGVAMVSIAYGPSLLFWAALLFLPIRWLLRRRRR